MSAPSSSSPVALGDRQFAQVLRRAVLLPLILILLGALALLWQMRRANLMVDRVERSEDVVIRCALAEQLIVDEETGVRGLQTTGNMVFLGTYREAERQLPQVFTQLQASLGENPDELALLNQLRTTHAGWEQGFAVPLIATIQAGGKTDDVDLNLLGKQQMDLMRRLSTLR